MPRHSPTPRTFELRDDVRSAFPPDPAAAFDRILALDGRVYRELDGRRTLRFELPIGSFFLKAHFGTPWREILKNLCSLRRPILGARTERVAIARVEALGLESTTVAGFGERGVSPARRQSFLITDEILRAESLEDHCRGWARRPPAWPARRAIIESIADVLRRLHDGGIHHRDAYACHFLLDLDEVAAATKSPHALEEPLRLFVIDLHRAAIFTSLPRRARVKDLAALLFSSLDFGLTRTDLLRFVRVYCRRDFRASLRTDLALWSEVAARAASLYRKEHGREPPRSATP